MEKKMEPQWRQSKKNKSTYFLIKPPETQENEQPKVYKPRAIKSMINTQLRRQRTKGIEPDYSLIKSHPQFDELYKECEKQIELEWGKDGFKLFPRQKTTIMVMLRQQKDKYKVPNFQKFSTKLGFEKTLDECYKKVFLNDTPSTSAELATHEEKQNFAYNKAGKSMPNKQLKRRQIKSWIFDQLAREKALGLKPDFGQVESYPLFKTCYKECKAAINAEWEGTDLLPRQRKIIMNLLKRQKLTYEVPNFSRLSEKLGFENALEELYNFVFSNDTPSAPVECVRFEGKEYPNNITVKTVPGKTIYDVWNKLNASQQNNREEETVTKDVSVEKTPESTKLFPITKRQGKTILRHLRNQMKTYNVPDLSFYQHLPNFDKKVDECYRIVFKELAQEAQEAQRQLKPVTMETEPVNVSNVSNVSSTPNTSQSVDSKLEPSQPKTAYNNNLNQKPFTHRPYTFTLCPPSHPVNYKPPGAGVPRSFLVNNPEGYAIQPPNLSGSPQLIPQLNTSNIQRMTLNLKPKPEVINRTATTQVGTQNPAWQPNLYHPNQQTNNPSQPMFNPSQPMFNPSQPMFNPSQPMLNPSRPALMSNQSSYMQNYNASPSTFVSNLSPNSPSTSSQLYINTDSTNNANAESSPVKQMYSPSDIYMDVSNEEEKKQQELRDSSESPDFVTGQKRLSAFKRLGPVAEAKKPKLTINLTLNKDDAVREVVDDTKQLSPKETVPFHQRPDVTTSTDEIVLKYLLFWPWKKKFSTKKLVKARSSKTVMIMELEQMEELYQKDTIYLQITVKGYPKHWTMQQVLDALLEALKGKSFIPCFIDFTENKCKFLVIRSYGALVAIHKLNFVIQVQNIEMYLTISDITLSLNHLDFIPRLVISKRLSMNYDGERKLSLKAFTLEDDVSHFIYFPLNRHTNQTEIVRIQSVIAWDYITDLDLSHNKLRSIDGFDLTLTCPKLKYLDLSHNLIEKATILLKIRALALKSIKLEGNPLCHNYIDSDHYVKVLKTMFSGLMEIDGVAIQLKGEFPLFEKNYCPEECEPIVSKFLETFFPLMESPAEDRGLMENLYHEEATLTITYKYKLRYCSVYRYFRNIFLRSRILDEGELDSIAGASNISKHYSRWPELKHDNCSFTVDVVWFSDTSIVIRVGGILKLTAETLAEDEEILAFTRTFVLISEDFMEYKIRNEMVYWENATEDCMNNAFKVTTLKPYRPSLKLESVPNDDLKEKLTMIFMKVTSMDKLASERCLELKDWNFKNALQLFHKLLQVDNLDYLLEAKKN